MKRKELSPDNITDTIASLALAGRISEDSADIFIELANRITKLEDTTSNSRKRQLMKFKVGIINPDTGMEMGWNWYKETIIVWMVIIITLACGCIVVGAPFLFLYYVGFGNWQIAVCGLWLTFWVSLAVAIEKSRDKAEDNKK